MAAKNEGKKMKTGKSNKLYTAPYNRLGSLVNVELSQNDRVLHVFLGRIQSNGGVDIQNRKLWLSILKDKESYHITISRYDDDYPLFDGTLEG